MWQWLIRLLGHRVVHSRLAPHTERGGVLDVRFGFRLLRDRRVPAGARLLALGLGIGLTAVLLACEAPLELMLAAVLPILGFLPDVIADGMEIILCPLIFASLFLPRLAPRQLVLQLKDQLTH